MQKNNKVVLFLLVGIWMGCGSNDDPKPFDCAQSPITINTNLTNVGCELNNGSIEILHSGATGEVLFSIDNGANFQSSGVFENLAVGNYTILVKDENDCEATASVVLSSADSDLDISLNVDMSAGCKTSNGQVTITASGGDEPYSYKVDDESFQSSNVFTNLSLGSHEFTVKDSNGCEAANSVDMLTGVSYSASIQNIITTKCAISGCHNGDNGANRNWTIFSNVQSKASNIKSRTASGSMPPATSSAGALSQEQKDLIACWVDDGAMDN